MLFWRLKIMNTKTYHAICFTSCCVKAEIIYVCYQRADYEYWSSQARLLQTTISNSEIYL